ncbi:MAG: Lysyl-tRNA synthetase [Candidatus Nomurabacteria bacterium GW2011_GWA2_43_66]|uniref:ATP-dependent zinc metalloprotease FtsH n=1 Tax=Candidatus Nomurabacteria bacterium GW2011_GWF2_43_24 TaxID=1618778 RepID=A0A0G1EP49_9BACT|nr:MAG: Lysyl-tRNA synthetase [Parcubacteria group bacterium GW2011_GWC1_42_21]KKS58774.1 MAG: Lysyl-tRNA synthetase [Candidatus Nomurabacteria bacterium GW2011_GWF1_42_40]KKT00098.1 MAG: Lysyl-tRNA synthetase [Candidatus Nomurabacteria bacterium GW2011_GWA1_43_17]KKT08033.1 MAG: Lysyl-tRNA synthetase [Candidatus Nomurabacteria bacterium GW2011_GWB1_43_19]KKT11583.1 MAG: Lysyl-tRNA synthetase [Candidatus Nomurabacteria bacterium GW2011_GWF2_43_24]KKT18115.1 MAG: Lysyl-tRNA synthetase [Candidat
MDFNFLNQKDMPNKGKRRQPPTRWGGSLLGALLFFMLITALYLTISGEEKVITEVAISDLAKSVQTGEVKSILVEGDKLTITYKNDEVKTAKKEVGSALSQTLFNYGVTSDALSKTEIQIKNESGFMYWLVNVMPFLLPIVFILLFFWYLSRQVKGAGMQAFSFGQSKARITDPNDKNNRVTFKDVAGCKEAKEELKEIVDFLKSPKKFLDIGARIPKGVILTGAPGTGKTLLARAVAGEASVPFFHLSGSEFVEMFVGVGASRVRDLFKMAKRAAPAIIFVDEIDAIGRTRGGGFGGGNDEREQTLNQILVEMDGFEPNDKVIVMAATNRPDVLDPALIRPGRFDRKVLLDLPDRADREEILKIHAVRKPLAEDINLKLIAERTPGFSGADLYSLMNEGAILAARENRKKVFQFDLIRAIEKVMLGPERKSHLLSKKEKEITAYHEAGHAIVASVLPFADPVHKVSIIARGNAGGYTLKLPLEERRLQSKKEFIDDIAMSLGGYVAEQMIFKDITTGPSSDLIIATNIARAMVTRWGMSDIIGPIALVDSGGRPQYGEITEKEFSETVSTKVDAEVSRIINEGLRSAEKVLTEHKKAFTAIAKKLIEVETLEQEEYEKILTVHGIMLKKKEEPVLSSVG